MDDLDKLAAARGQGAQPTPRRVREVPSKLLRSAIAWTVFVALVVFLPMPVFIAVVGGFATPLMVAAGAFDSATSADAMGLWRVLLPLAAIVIYVLPCWGVTRLIVWAMRPLRDLYAILATLVVVIALFRAAHLPIFGLGHNSMPS